MISQDGIYLVFKNTLKHLFFFKLLLNASSELLQSASGLPWCLLRAYRIAKILVKLFSRHLSSISFFFSFKMFFISFINFPELFFFSTHFYCWSFGLIVSFHTSPFLAHYIPLPLIFSSLQYAFSSGFQAHTQALGRATTIPTCTHSQQ